MTSGSKRNRRRTFGIESLEGRNAPSGFSHVLAAVHVHPPAHVHKVPKEVPDANAEVHKPEEVRAKEKVEAPETHTAEKIEAQPSDPSSPDKGN